MNNCVVSHICDPGTDYCNRQGTHQLITYIAHAAGGGGSLASLATAIRTLDLFRHLCVPFHYANATHPSHTSSYEFAKEAYARRPAFRSVVAGGKMFDKNLSIAVADLSPQGHAPEETTSTHMYAAYIRGCLRRLAADFGGVDRVMIDHADDLGVWGYGRSLELDALIDDGLERLFRSIASQNCMVHAFGHPFWRSNADRGWFEGRVPELGPAHATYTKGDPQPTVGQQRERFAALAAQPGPGCMFFKLIDADPREVAMIHKGDENARKADVLCLWPQPGDPAKGSTPFEKVEEYMAEMKR